MFGLFDRFFNTHSGQIWLRRGPAVVFETSTLTVPKVSFYLAAFVVTLFSWSSKPAIAQGLPQFEQVQIESFSGAGLFSSEQLKIDGYLLRSGRDGKSPGAVLAPACAGLLNEAKRVRPWYRQMAVQLKYLGITSVLIDGFNPRGTVEICTQKLRDRTIDTATRMSDSLAGLRYMRGRKDIDAGKVFLITWGAAGSLETMSRDNPKMKELGSGFTASIMFYPDCAGVNRPYSAYAPIKMLIGEKDDWNPPASCLALAADTSSNSAPVTVKLFPDALHGFDTPQPVHEMHDVGGHKSVTVGGNLKARKEAHKEIAAFLTGSGVSPATGSK